MGFPCYRPYTVVYVKKTSIKTLLSLFVQGWKSDTGVFNNLINLINLMK